MSAALPLRLVPAAVRHERFYANDVASPQSNLLYHPWRRSARLAERLGWTLHRLRLTPQRAFELDELGLYEAEVDGAAVFVSQKLNRDRFLVALTPAQGKRVIVKSGAPAHLRIEANMLEKLGASSELAFIPPVVLDQRVSGNRLSVVLTHLQPAGRQELDDEEVLRLALSLASVDVTHGDFCPWNTVRSRHGTGLYDWEYSTLGLRLAYDLTHYVVQTATYRTHESAADCAARLLDLGKRYAEGLGLRHAEVEAGINRYLEQPGEPWGGFSRADRLRHDIKEALARRTTD